MRTPGPANLGILRGRDTSTYYAKSVAGSADVTLRAEETMAGTIAFTGALTGSIVVFLPLYSQAAGNAWEFLNLTTGQHTLTVKAVGATGPGVVIARGDRVRVFYDGSALSEAEDSALPDQIQFVWIAGERGLPQLNAVIDTNVAGAVAADRHFEILGTNASSDDVTYHAEGGIQMETDGADGDEVILLPHLNAGQTPWTAVTWGSDQQTEWECRIRTGANIGNCIVWAGLKLTNTEVTATDDHQAFFRYENGVNSGKWQAITSVGGTDDAHDSGVTVVLSTEYRLKIRIDEARVPRYYINGTLVETGGALANTTDFIPYIGVAADGAAEAKAIVVYGQAIKRKAA